VSVPFWLALVRRIGLARSWLAGMLLNVVVFVFALGLGTGDTAAFFAICAASGIALGTDLALPSAMLAGVIGSAGHRGQLEGGYFGWWNLAAKLNLALAAGLALPLLQLAGYVPGGAMPPAWPPSRSPTACCPASSSWPRPRPCTATSCVPEVPPHETQAAPGRRRRRARRCAAPEPARYAAERPELDLRNYFNGVVDAWGIFTDRSGAVVKRFTVVLTCSWQGDEGVLDEDFTYSDGTKQRRVWRLTRHGDGRYTGRADDVVGVAKASNAATRCAGATPWRCRWTGACGTCSSTTGCS
jgi:hypothetical protein